MKVLMIGTDRNLFKEGSGVRARLAEYGTLFEELAIIVFTRRDIVGPLDAHGGISIATNVRVYPTRSLHKSFFIQDAIKLGKRIAVSWRKASDVPVVVSGQDPFETGIVAWRVARSCGAKFHVQIHTDPWSPEFTRVSFLNRVRVLIAKFLLPKASAVRVVSAAGKRALQSRGIEAPISVLPIFVDFEKIQEAPIDVDLRQMYTQFSLRVLMVARLEREKNVCLALRAFKLFLETKPDAGLFIVGEGRERDFLEREVSRLGITGSVVFLGGQKPSIISYYKTADVFLQTSRFEGFGLALVEAVVAGIPAVSTDVGIARDLLSAGGFVCDVADARCVAQALSLLSANPFKRKEAALLASAQSRTLFPVGKERYLQLVKSAFTC